MSQNPDNGSRWSDDYTPGTEETGASPPHERHRTTTTASGPNISNNTSNAAQRSNAQSDNWWPPNVQQDGMSEKQMKIFSHVRNIEETDNGEAQSVPCQRCNDSGNICKKYSERALRELKIYRGKNNCSLCRWEHRPCVPQIVAPSADSPSDRVNSSASIPGYRSTVDRSDDHHGGVGEQHGQGGHHENEGGTVGQGHVSVINNFVNALLEASTTTLTTENRKFRDTIKGLETETIKLKNEVERLTTEVETARDREQKGRAEIEKLKNENSRLNALKERLEVMAADLNRTVNMMVS